MLNKTDLEWCTGTENDNKHRKNMGRSRGRRGWIGLGLGGLDGQPPSFRTAHQKNIPKYNAWKNIRNDTWVPKKSRKLPVTISFIEVIFSEKEGTL